MIKYYPLIIGIMDTLNEWDQKLKAFTTGKLDNVAVGTAIVGIIFVVSAWGIRTLNKK